MFVTYPDTPPPFATVALRACTGSPGYVGRIRSLTRMQGVRGHSSGPEHLSMPGAAAISAWRSAAQGSDVGVDAL